MAFQLMKYRAHLKTEFNDKRSIEFAEFAPAVLHQGHFGTSDGAAFFLPILFKDCRELGP